MTDIHIWLPFALAIPVNIIATTSAALLGWLIAHAL
jgi:hypothetical protein